MDKKPKLILAEHFLAKKFKTRENVLSPWLPVGGLTFISAKAGLGKTRLALGIAVAVASGGTFLSFTAGKPRNVLYIDSEMAAAQLQEWLQAAVTTAGLTKAPEKMFVLSDAAEKERLPSILSPHHQRAFYDPRIEQADLIILDNLVSLGGARSELWPDSLARWTVALRRMGKSLLVLAHAGKGKADAYRGSSRIITNADSVLTLRRPDGYVPEQGARFIISHEKSRGYFGNDAAPFEAHYREGKWHTEGVVSAEDQCKSLILAALALRPYTLAELRSVVLGDNISAPKLRGLLNDMKSLGVERMNIASSTGNKAMYWRPGVIV